jgi:hypothetical protein
LALASLSRLSDPQLAGAGSVRFLDDRHQVGGQGLQVGFVLGRAAETFDHYLGVVLAPELATIDQQLDAASQRIE